MPLPLRTPTLHPFHTPLAIVSLLGMLLAASTRADDAKGEAGVTEDPSGGLHGTLATVRKPLKTFALPVTGEIRDLCITPDAKRLVLHELASKKDGSRVSRVSVMDLATDKVTLLQEWPSMAMKRLLAVAPDGKSVVLEELKDGAAGRYDLETGKKIQRYDTPQDKPVGSLQVSPDGKRMSGSSRDFGAVYWNLDDGSVHHAALDFTSNKSGFYVYPLCDRTTLLVIALPAKQDAPSKLVLVEPENGKTTDLTEISENFDVRFDATGKTLLIFRQQDPAQVAWTGIDVWDVATAKLARTIKLKPPMSSLALTLTRDSRHLFLHQYMMQQAVVWDLQSAKPLGTVGPELGGFTAFSITPDGNKLIGVFGSWVEGALQADKIGLFDTSPLLR